MCSMCHKRMAVVFVTKAENGVKSSKGLCLKCAKQIGVPVDNIMGDMLNKLGISPEQLEEAEGDLNAALEQSTPSDADDNEDGGAPAIDLPKLFRDSAAIFAQATDGAEDGVVPADEHTAQSDKKSRSKSQRDKKLKFLPVYSRNLTQYAREEKLDRIVGRDRELSRVIQILCRRQKNNPCLIGEPGVGKTAIAEALAMRIADGDVPYKLRNKEIYLLDMTALVAGTQFRGQFESRILGLLNEVRELGNAILVIDEVHNIVGTGEAEGSVNAANILKPALSRGEVQIIGATTLNEYRRYIEKDSALERRFQTVTVQEPSVDETVEMLMKTKHYYEEFHAVHISESLLRRAVLLSERYITDRYLPDKAIDLIDEAASACSLASASLNESYQIRDRLLELRQRKESLEGEIAGNTAVEQNRYEEVANIQSEELRLSARLSELEQSAAVELTERDIANVIELWTGIPATGITENEYVRLDRLDSRLKEHIIGQDAAIDAVTKAIKRNRAGVSYQRKPVSFIFAGPTGVGKTELVKVLAADLFQSPETLIRLDMSEFMEKHSVSRIIGAPPGYVGYDEAGQLTEKIRRRPYSVVLFDEIEKAHPDVFNILLQILDDGRITDARGKTVNFENTVIIMTTNAGSDRSASVAGFSADAQNRMAESATQKALEAFLRPEFLNRVDEVITFRSLSREDFERIAVLRLEELKKSLLEKSISFSYSDEAVAYIAEHSFSAKYGARNMKRYIQKEVEDPLAECIIADYAGSVTNARLTSGADGLQIHCI